MEGNISGSSIRRIYGKPPENLNDKEWEEVGYNLGMGLRNVITFFAPDVIVLGGGIVIGARDKILNPAKKVTEKYTLLKKP